jgi:argininosuccinate lyase
MHKTLLAPLHFARANVKTGILKEEEFQAIQAGLEQVEKEWENGSFQIKDGDEDIHTANERRLGELVGKGLAGKLHT